MIVIPYKAEHLHGFQLQEGQMYQSPYITNEYAKFLEGEFSFTAFAGDKIVAIGGIAKLWENRGLAWTLISKDAGEHFMELHRVVKQIIEVVPYKRIEADTPCEFKAGHRWLRMLGFKLEAERMRAFRVDGGDSSLYALVR